jgi:diaminopimelate decarboxylase
VGIDAGWHQACARFVYDEPLEVGPVAGADAPATGTVTVTGNINEGDDLWTENAPMAALEEGDIVAILGVGAYAASVASEHCLRPPPASVAFAERLP